MSTQYIGYDTKLMSMTNAELLHFVYSASEPDDYNASWTEYGRHQRSTSRAELERRLRVCGFLPDLPCTSTPSSSSSSS